jgi:hypothetical protein
MDELYLTKYLKYKKKYLISKGGAPRMMTQPSIDNLIIEKRLNIRTKTDIGLSSEKTFIDGFFVYNNQLYYIGKFNTKINSFLSVCWRIINPKDNNNIFMYNQEEVYILKVININKLLDYSKITEKTIGKLFIYYFTYVNNKAVPKSYFLVDIDKNEYYHLDIYKLDGEFITEKLPFDLNEIKIAKSKYNS